MMFDMDRVYQLYLQFTGYPSQFWYTLIMQELKDLDIKIGQEIGQISPLPAPEPVADLAINVGQTKIENLFTRGELPAGTKEVGNPKKGLTVSFVEGQTLQQIFDYMRGEQNGERGGNLVGRYIETSAGKVVQITDFVPSKRARTTGASVTFTADDYSDVNRWIVQNKPGSQFIGWVHSHPFWTPAPSADDVFMMENFFNLPHQVTMIVNQNTMEVGDFRYVNGQVENTEGFYLNPSGLRGLGEITITSDTRLDQKSGGQKVILNSLPDAGGTVSKIGRVQPDETLKITTNDLEIGSYEEFQAPIKITRSDLK